MNKKNNGKKYDEFEWTMRKRYSEYEQHPLNKQNQTDVMAHELNWQENDYSKLLFDIDNTKEEIC